MKIWYLCSNINNVEWSGIIFCKTEGHPINPETFRVEAVDVLPMHKGEPTYTEFELDERLIDAYDNNPILETCKMGIIHSHANMNVFFSATDIKTLEEYAKLSNYCISVIVNNKGKIIAKAAYPSLVKSKKENLFFKNSEGQWESYDSKDIFEEQVIINEVDLTIETSDDSFFKKNVEFIITESFSCNKTFFNDETDRIKLSTNKQKTLFEDDFYKYKEEKDSNPKYLNRKDKVYNFICKCITLEKDSESIDIKGCLKQIERFIDHENMSMYGNLVYDNLRNYYTVVTKSSSIDFNQFKDFLEECLLILEDYILDYEIAQVVFNSIENYIFKNKYKKTF